MAEDGQPGADAPRVAVSGASGLIGRRVCADLERAGMRPVRLVRRPTQAGGDEVRWDPDRATIDGAALEGLTAVVHLAGQSIAAGRWTAARRKSIRDSRVRGTTLLAQTLAGLRQPPRTLLSASAIGYYGDRGSEPLVEASPPGEGYLPEVCRVWEAAAQPAADAGIRVVIARLGMVLSGFGGALPAMLAPIKLGLGGRLGSGRQYVSWISLTDASRAIVHLLQIDDPAGAVNLVSPEPMTNREFVSALARAVHRPAWLPAPAFLLRLALGGMARELLLASTRVLPRRLEASGFQYHHPRLEAALLAELGLQSDGPHLRADH